jgi:N,N-dimethylformamidase beta subunit-like protein
VNWEMQWDYQLIRFLESKGYDLSYATDVDTAQGLDAPGARRLVIVAGHSEYWSKEIRDALDGAQASGTNMAFMGANTGYWQMRYANNYRAILEYRSASADPSPNPATKTTRFGSLNPSRPECLLEGVQDLVGVHDGLGSQPSNRDYHVAPAALTNPWFAGSGLTASSVLTGLVGYEWDTANQPGCPHVQILFTWTGTNVYRQSSEADAATFTAASGARVFAAGSFQYTWGLDNYAHSTTPVSPQLQTFTQNMLNNLS